MPHDVLERLLANLLETHGVYKRLLGIAEQKQEHILQNDTDCLREDLQAEAELAGRGAQLNAEREDLHRRCCNSLSSPTEVATLEDLCQYMPAEWHERFELERKGLRRTLERLHGVNRVNVSLVNSSLEFMEGLLAALFDTERISAYGHTGIRDRAEIPVRTLDASA